MHTVFVVDDEPAVAESFASAIARDDRRVVAFADPRQALLALLTHEDVDLLMTDVQMPMVPWSDLVEAARADRPNLSVILMSSDHDNVLEAEKKGIPFMAKPVTLEELEQWVSRSLERAQARET